MTITPEQAGVKTIVQVPAALQKQMSKPLTKHPETVRMEDLEFDPILFENMRTGRPADLLFTPYPGGVPRATIYMMIGDPGVGKSTVALDILADLQKSGHKVLFISGEMNRIDLYGYVRRYPKFAKVPILFLGEYLDQDPRRVIDAVLSDGYDCVLIDSFVEVQDTIREACKVSAGSAEKWLLDTMLQHNVAKNTEKRWTTFLVIQQVTKNHSFAGSMKLKHNTTGMMELRFDEDGSHYAFFDKNRRGDAHRKMYFDLKTEGQVFYDSRRFHSDTIARSLSEEELGKIAEEEAELDKLLGLNSVKVPVLSSEPVVQEVQVLPVSSISSSEGGSDWDPIKDLGFEDYDRDVNFSSFNLDPKN
jgi:predicted ATP-dependent serine protease